MADRISDDLRSWLSFPQNGLATGALAVVRNRSGLIANMVPSAGSLKGIVNLVTVAYADRDGIGQERIH